MLESEKRVFFAQKSGTPHTVSMGGKKVAFANFPQETQDVIMNKLAEKDDVVAQGMQGILPGIKIDGKVVTRENLHEFEKKSMSKPKIQKEESKPKEIIEPKITKKYTKTELKNLNKKQQTEILESFGVIKIPKLENTRIKKILEIQI